LNHVDLTDDERPNFAWDVAVYRFIMPLWNHGRYNFGFFARELAITFIRNSITEKSVGNGPAGKAEWEI